MMLNSAREMPFFLDKSWQVWAANRRPPKADQRAISTSSRPARVRRPPASGEEAQPMRLRTPAIRRDRPTVRGSPALRARSTSAGLVPAELSAKNHPCDAKDHARPRKYLEQNSFLKRGVQVQPWFASATHGAPAYPLRSSPGIQAESFARNPYEA